ncbi:MAG TPA: TspO/MBR family protein [Thermoanaerobaculia bacterium]|nr:TspO/MBR family protein [Thermoanaerobaculia bacterium]
MTTTPNPAATTIGRSILALAGFLLLSFAAGAIGGRATYPAIPGWYRSLEKPSWTPPDWLFGPAWTTLYILMGVAAWLVWRHGGWRTQKRPLTLFVVQVVLNALWSLLFFGLRNPALGMAEIVVLWLAILATLIAFWKVSRVAGGLMVPYLGWVTFAAALNFAIWRLNG